ncbi:helix-turn-helix domain-containing protein [Streptomyces sp. V4-01]|uniref:Helix-turn-helix domain-containing protein n=1 Tax=Actinacidiphila polyblastidii TaxID=3110430 RepID=A0ABU7P7F9_9ACTN|nr:helix-turn-helix domain-containing protein [Streptomyces sp. V4-01]
MAADGVRDVVCERALVDCRLRAATELLAHTWDPLVLAALSPGPLRRSALLASTGGMSDKVLTEALRRLLANGLVERRTYPAAPPRVEYGLTPLGASLTEGPLRALADWALDHGEQLLDAQERAAAAAVERRAVAAGGAVAGAAGGAVSPADAA